MSQENPYTAGLSSIMSSWMKMAADNWGQSGNPWSTPFSSAEKKEKRSSRSQDSLESLLKTWRMVSSTVGRPENLQANLAGMGELPNILMQLARVSLEGVNRLQEKMLDKTGQSSGRTSLNLDSFDEQFFEEWKTLYESEIRKYFNIPQLGLMRFYQEKFNQTADKYNVLQSATAEFMFVLSKPFETSVKALQDQILEQTEKNEWSADAKESYNHWIAILESDFMKLMKSPEYLKALGRVLSAQAEFSGARDEVIQDMAANMPFAGRKEMDELYQELYQLRKRVRELEKVKK